MERWSLPTQCHQFGGLRSWLLGVWSQLVNLFRLHTTLVTGRHTHSFRPHSQAKSFPLLLAISRTCLFQPLYAKLTQACGTLVLPVPSLLRQESEVEGFRRWWFTGHEIILGFQPESLLSVPFSKLSPLFPFRQKRKEGKKEVREGGSEGGRK